MIIIINYYYYYDTNNVLSCFSCIAGTLNISVEVSFQEIIAIEVIIIILIIKTTIIMYILAIK